jgi:hypothetical protein
MSTMTIDSAQVDATHGPACSQCRGPTRLTGIEPHPTQSHTDLRTFQCLLCNHVQATVIAVEGNAQQGPVLN